jgi:hypothetical protein
MVDYIRLDDDNQPDMARPPSIKKNVVSTALILMRSELGFTQAQLAEALQVALPSVGKWESWGPPKGVILERLAVYAEVRGLSAAKIFRYALEKEKSRRSPSWLRVESDEEQNQLKAHLLILRDPEFAHLRPKLRRLLAPALNEPESRLTDDEQLRQLRAEMEAEKAAASKPKKRTERPATPPARSRTLFQKRPEDLA